MNIKTRMLVSVFFLELFGYGLFLFYLHQTIKSTLTKNREDQIQAIIYTNYNRINNITNALEDKAGDLANAGEKFYALKSFTTETQLEPILKKFLTTSISDYPEALGGGIWYEPNVFYADKTFYGPYVFWNKKKQIEFTWNLNTPEYNYHHQSWYLKALPADWDRSIRRPEKSYWTAPYYDEAGSKELILTIDKLIYSPDDTIVGMATVDWSLRAMTAFIESIAITPNTKTVLLDTRSELVLSNTLQPENVMKKRQDIPWLSQIDFNSFYPGSINSTESVNINSKDYRMYYLKTEMGLLMGIAIPLSEIHSEIDAATKKILLYGALIISAFILGMLVLLELMFNPFVNIKNLINKSIYISEDNTLKITPVTYHHNNEFSSIIDSINLIYRQINNYTREIEDANKAKTTFLATMSHEIRTPMNAILGYTQLLSLESNFPAEYQETIQAINSSGRHLLNLLNDILDITKIESGAMKLNNENVYLCDLIENIGHMFKLRCLQKQLAWNSSIQIPSNLIAFVDKSKISQILINLLGNSLKFTDQGALSLNCYIDSTNLQIEISDSGAGMSEAHLEKISTPFLQGAAGQAKGGTGLGLTIVYKLIGIMSGDIQCTSIEGIGTTFKMTIPVAEENSNYLAAKRHAHLEMTNFSPLNLTALVVDDVKINRDILVKVLSKLGIEAIQAANGEEALMQINAHKPHILFIDIQMPVMDGFELLEHIKREYPQLSSRTIAISAHVYSHSSEYKNKGFAYYITKPFLIAEIGSTVEAIVVEASDIL